MKHTYIHTILFQHASLYSKVLISMGAYVKQWMWRQVGVFVCSLHAFQYNPQLFLSGMLINHNEICTFPLVVVLIKSISLVFIWSRAFLTITCSLYFNTIMHYKVHWHILKFVINQSINHQSINQSINQWVNQSINQSINPFIHPSIHPYASIHVSIHSSINQSIHPIKDLLKLDENLSIYIAKPGGLTDMERQKNRTNDFTL